MIIDYLYKKYPNTKITIIPARIEMKDFIELNSNLRN